MATQEKLLKSLECLKQLQNANQSSGGDVLQKKKEKIQHCNVIVEAIQNSSLKLSKNFNNLLNCTVETLLQLCDDPEADIRMIADECLNKIIRGMNNGSISKIQIELHKGVKQNGSARSLRAALSRFALLAHHIRPHKGKVYVTNIIPALIKVIERNEESVHETLATSLPQIMQALGPFTMDYDIKGLLRACLNNVQSPSVVVRRMTAHCLLTICLNNRAPFVFLCYVFNYLFDLLIPVLESHSNQLILGCLSCLKLLIPQFHTAEVKHKMNSHFKGRNVADSCISTDKLLQIYELCLYYTMHSDHNIVNSSLETLNILLSNLNLELKTILMQKSGVGKSHIFHADPSKIRLRSPSQLSIATTLKSEENLLLESDFTDFAGTDIEKWIDESKLSVINVNYVKDEKDEKSNYNAIDHNVKNETKPVPTTEYGNINIGTINDQYADSFRSESIAENMDKLILSENSSEKSFSHQTEEKFSQADVEYVHLNVDIGDFLDQDVSLLFCSRLLIKQFLLNGVQNTTIPETIVRVSIKNLALTCLSTILQIYPNALVKYLDKNCGKKDVAPVTMQRITDVLLYECHDDPQIRGVIRVLIANFIRTVLLQSFGDFTAWMRQFSDYEDDLLPTKYLVNLLLKGLEDESSTCTRQCLTSLTTCLNPLLESEYSSDVIPVLNYLPLMAQDPYWLVKVKLVELITTFSYVNVEHVTKSKEFQNKVIHNILLELLRDEDQRVRNAASSAIIKIIPLLYFQQNLSEETKITYKAILHRNLYSTPAIENNLETNIKMLQQVEHLPFPFNSGTLLADPLIEKSLSRIITQLYRKLLTQSTKYYTLGCIETLCSLSYAYPVTVYRNAWNCFNSCTVRFERPTFARSISTPSQISEEILTTSKDLLSLTVNLLTMTTVVYDTNCHLHLIKLVGNLFAGKWLQSLKPTSELNHDTIGELWELFTDSQLSVLSEEYLVHLVKILNIYAHVIEDNNSLSQPKAAIANLPLASNMSPLKRRKSDLGDKRVLSPGKAVDKESEKKEIKPNNMGFYANSPHYMKIYEILKVAYNNYKVTLNIEASENFLGFLKAVLYSLCQILEIATLAETGRIAEEILMYLKSTFNLEPTTTVQCVQQLLKSLFGTNVCSDTDEFSKYLCKDTSEPEVQGTGFFYHIAQVPIINMSDCVGKFNEISKNEVDGDSIVMGYVHRKDYKKITNKNIDKILGNYIRIFEPMVIKSLKHYTMTSDAKLQAHVLQLLSQLVLLRVNYCLLDSEQVFIDFVFKQFQFMEEGQIGLAHELIPKIFQFLVHLSYGKQHTKSIIVIPRIIQLCDGLMASGQSPKTHCIPALKPIVEDVFLLRNKSNTPDFKELETTREVLVSMLLKLIEYSDIINLLVLILKDSKYCENTDRWLRWSKKVFDTFMIQLRNNKIELEDPNCMNAARSLLFSLHPNVYKPISHIFIAIFEEAIDISTVSGDRFLGKLNLLLLITSQLNENKFLLKIEEVQSEIPPHCIFEKFQVIHDPLNVSKTTGIFDGITPEVIFLKYIFRTITFAVKYCVQNEYQDEKTNIVQQLHSFLNYCLYLFQSGTHNKITTIGISLLNGDMEDVVEGLFLETTNKHFLQLRPTCPLLTFQWCYILTLLNYNDRKFWADVIQITDNYGIDLQLVSNIEPKVNCINLEIVRVGGSIVFADYMSEHILSDGEQMAWLLVNNIKLIVEHHEEAPIYELLGSIHRNVAASSLLIQAIDSKCIETATISTKAKILKCLENVHESQTGNLLKFLLPKMLDLQVLAITRQASSLASRKIELLLTLSVEEVQKQLPKEELSLILESLVSLKLVKRHEMLIGLLNKLSSQFYDFSPLEFDQRRSIKPEYIKNLSIDKAWYLSQLKQRCLGTRVSSGYAEILNKLSYDELWTIMNHKDFNKKIIYDCFNWCINHLEFDDEIPEILQASSAVINRTVISLRNVVPKSHHVYRPYGRDATHAEMKYSNRLTEILEEESFFQFLIDIIPCVTEYIACTARFTKLVIPEGNLEDFTKFAVICLEIISFNIDISSVACFNVNFTSTCLRCAELIFKVIQLCNNLAPDAQVTWLTSAINSLYKLVSFLLTDMEPLPSMPVGCLREALSNVDTLSAGQAVQQLYELVCWLEKVDFTSVEIPNYLLQSIMSIVISLARLPLVNSYILTPPSAWKSGWYVQLTGTFHTQVPPLPLEYLQEVDILEEFIYRILLLGWTSRTQFEETWVSLLSALNSNPTVSEPEDINALTHSNSLAVQAITAFLLQTLYAPQPGNKCVSSYIHVPRDSYLKQDTPTFKKLRCLHKRFSQKLLENPDCLKKCHRHLNVFEKLNIEKMDGTYSYSQMSLEYLRISANLVEVDGDSYAAQVCRQRQDKLQKLGLDLRSCLQFQLDLYMQWLKADETVPLRLLQEIVKSLVQTSDIFNDRTQFNWMLTTCLDLSKVHAVEDEIVHLYLVIAICKAAAVLHPDRDILEYVKKLVSQSLKNTFLSSRIAGLHGLLFMLQMCLLDNTVIGGISEEMQLFLPIAIDYIEYNISSNNVVLQQSEEHTLLVWALVFYVIESIDVPNIEEHFVDTVFTTLLSTLSAPDVNTSILLPLIKGVESLLLKKRIPLQFRDKVIKYATTQFKRNSPNVALPAAQLLFTCLYMEYSEHIDNSEDGAIVPSNPDHLVQSIENISAIFDKIKKGYPFEVDLLSVSLSNLLTDIFSPSDILTKVISEFLSPHQRHPMQLCKVVFNIFESAIQQSQLSLLQDWVVFSLTNFTQSFSIGMATWCLTCFFISASKNVYLRNLFPYVQRRMGRYEYEDRKFLCIAGSDFYKNLTDASQKTRFISTLVSVKDQADMPFNELLLCL